MWVGITQSGESRKHTPKVFLRDKVSSWDSSGAHQGSRPAGHSQPSHEGQLSEIHFLLCTSWC